jgi:5'-3' exonuclease
MGIPFYFKHIIQKYNNITRKKHNLACDRLFLDFNCAIHHCANMCSANMCSQTNANQQIKTEDQMEDYVIECCKSYLQYIIDWVKPKDLVYVAIDGVCPFSKMIQQRNRRFISDWRRKQIDPLLPTKPLWNSNIVTPGTQFMSRLNNALYKFCTELNAKASTPRVILSDSNEKGEGEHKIFQFIRSNTAGPIDVIYGLDADLILLSMLSPNSKNIYLMREKQMFDKSLAGDDFMLVAIGNLAAALYAEHEKNLTQVDKCHERFTADYAMLMTFAGNDFLPPLSHIKIKTNGIAFILNTYFKTIQELGTMWLVEKNTINGIVLSKFIGNLSDNEDTMMQEAIEIYQTKKVFPPFKAPALIIKNFELDNYPIINRFNKQIDASKAGWRTAYYHHLFGSTEQTMINDACKEYVEGILWVCSYYLTGVTPQSWGFKYSFSPSILDLNHFLTVSLLESHMNYLQKIDKINGFEFTPQFQLLLVMPPSCSYLLPTELQPVMNKVDEGCLQFYPHIFEISTFLKHFIWECHANLPPLCLKDLYLAYKKLTKA